MENQIYRIKFDSDITAMMEFYIQKNDFNQVGREKYLAITSISQKEQLDHELSLSELDSLIKFLQDCRKDIKEFNEPKKD